MRLRILARPTETLAGISALVLVFEDETHLRRLTEQLLIYRGYRVVAIRHGEMKRSSGCANSVAA